VNGQLHGRKAVLHFKVAINGGNITQVNTNPEPLTKLRRRDHNINAEAKEVSDTMVTQAASFRRYKTHPAFCSEPQLPTVHEEYFLSELVIVLRNIIQYFQGRN
jgi:hypothetical protein